MPNSINTKYSYNGYDPLDPVVIAKKEQLQTTWETAKKALADGIASANRDLAKGIITEQQHKDAISAMQSSHSQAYETYRIGMKAVEHPLKGINFTEINPAELSNTRIVGTSFYQQGKPYTKVFPVGVKNLELENCNLDNVDCSDPEIYVIGGCNNHIKLQNDGEFWIVGKDLKPVCPRDEAAYDRCGLSKDPKDIPVQPLAEPITFTHDPDIIAQKAIAEKMDDEAWIKQKLIDDGVIPNG